MAVNIMTLQYLYNNRGFYLFDAYGMPDIMSKVSDKASHVVHILICVCKVSSVVPNTQYLLFIARERI